MKAQFYCVFCMTPDTIASVALCDVAVLMLDGNEPVGFGIRSLIFPPFSSIICCEMAMNERASALLDAFAAECCTSARPNAGASDDRQGETRDVRHQQNRLHSQRWIQHPNHLVNHQANHQVNHLANHQASQPVNLRLTHPHNHQQDPLHSQRPIQQLNPQ